MKEIVPNLRPYLTRTAFYVLLLLMAACVVPFVAAQRTDSKRIVTDVRSASKKLARVGTASPSNVVVVTNTNDSGPGSLRQALADASDGDTIDATGVSGTISLTSGELQINHNVIINGPGAENLAVYGNDSFRVFENTASNVTITGFMITGGSVFGSNGGAIRNQGELTLSDSVVSSSRTDIGRSGGGIFVDAGGTLTLTNSTVSGNFSSGGGGIASSGQLTIINSTLSGNFVPLAGGQGGGMLLSAGTAKITESTISNNRLAGIHNSGGATQIKDTVLKAGFGVTIFNQGGTVTSLGYNLASDDGGGVLTGPGDQINTDPLLGPLQNNGGQTFTHALLAGSPAINAGDPSFTPPPLFDQRGPNFLRVSGGRIDVGSFECQGRCAPGPRPRPTPAPRP